MSGIEPAAVAEWRAAIGRQETRSERLEAESLRRYALAVGSDPDVERVPPPLAHWAFFLPQAPDAEIGPDGHPRRGGLLPAITLPRRMFAATHIQFDLPLRLGEPAVHTSTVVDVTHKAGRTGDLVFVEVERVLAQEGAPRATERQTYVYRDAGPPMPMPMPEVTPGAEMGDVWRPDEVNLFRFSAATFNSHRIHYDAPYARDVEGYPALVVHGPFAAARLAAYAGRRGPLASFAFRAQSPIFVGQPVRFEGDEAEVRAIRCDGAVAMSAKVTYA